MDNPAKLTKSKGLYEYVNLLNPPKQAGTHVNYRLLVELSKIFKEDRKNRVMKKLLDYGVIKSPEPEIEQLIEIAGNYSDEFDGQEKTQVDLDETAKKALRVLVIQNTIYQIAKSNDMQPRDFFKTLYQIILGTSRGPKIGPFISDIGRKQVARTISEYV